MLGYEEKAYRFQAQTRGLTEATALIATFDRLLPIYERRIGRVLPSTRDARILDCPCGYGNVSYWLAKAGYRSVDSIDLDPGQIDLARLVGVDGRVADAMEWLSHRPDTYDAVLSLDFLEHLAKDAAVEFCERVFAGLRGGGVFVARTPCADGPFFGQAAFNDLTHQWVATSGVIREMLNMCGFPHVTVLDDGPVPYKFINRVRRLAYDATCAVGSACGSFLGIGAPAIWTPNMWVIARKP